MPNCLLYNQSFPPTSELNTDMHVQFCLVIGGRVNANAFPESPKPLKQCGAGKACFPNLNFPICSDWFQRFYTEIEGNLKVIIAS